MKIVSPGPRKEHNVLIKYVWRFHTLVSVTYSVCFGLLLQVLLSGLIGVVSWKRPLSLVVSVL